MGSELRNYLIGGRLEDRSHRGIHRCTTVLNKSKSWRRLVRAAESLNLTVSRLSAALSTVRD